jgi:hypothetical protein
LRRGDRIIEQQMSAAPAATSAATPHPPIFPSSSATPPRTDVAPATTASRMPVRARSSFTSTGWSASPRCASM